jgi:hypothetical protein
VEDHTQERIVNLKPAVVGNKTQFTKLIHKEADTRTGRTNDFGERFLTYLWNNEFRFPILAKVRKK